MEMDIGSFYGTIFWQPIYVMKSGEQLLAIKEYHFYVFFINNSFLGNVQESCNCSRGYPKCLLVLERGIEGVQ